MPSQLHEALGQLFRNRPALAPELLRRGLGFELPSFAEARIGDATFTELQPAEYRADLVVLLTDHETLRLAIVVEVQLSRNARKEYVWPMYAMGLRARYECPACVLVVAPSEDVAEWARRPLAIGLNNTFTPHVLGPSAIPVVLSPHEAQQAPELAVLSVLAHGREDVAMSMVPAAFAAYRAVDVEYEVLYSDLIQGALSAAARAAFEELMDLSKYEPQSEYFRNLIRKAETKAVEEGIAKGLAEGTAKGLAEGTAKGLAEGTAKGLAEGLAAGKAESVLIVLRARGLVVSAVDEERIRGTGDLAQLDRWIARAATIDAVAALFV